MSDETVRPEHQSYKYMPCYTAAQVAEIPGHWKRFAVSFMFVESPHIKRELLFDQLVQSPTVHRFENLLEEYVLEIGEPYQQWTSRALAIVLYSAAMIPHRVAIDPSSI